jgi:hypothetical protein
MANKHEGHELYYLEIGWRTYRVVEAVPYVDEPGAVVVRVDFDDNLDGGVTDTELHCLTCERASSLADVRVAPEDLGESIERYCIESNDL